MGVGDAGHIRLPGDDQGYLALPGDDTEESKLLQTTQVDQTPAMDSTRAPPKKNGAKKFMPAEHNLVFKNPICACTGNGCCSCVWHFPFLFFFDCNCNCKHKKPEEDPELELA